MATKLAFSIASCSGEDQEGPARELLYQGPDSKGWCTPRYCHYPQEITLRLEVPARLTQIQLLSHEFKIAAKIELIIGTLDTGSHGGLVGAGLAAAPAAGDPGKASWRRLGFLSFDTNEGSRFRARELKSVALPSVPAHFLRLAVHRCHSNAANVHGQVGLVALNLMGDPLAPAPLSPITNIGMPYSSGAGMHGPAAGMLAHHMGGMSLHAGTPRDLVPQQHVPGLQQHLQPPSPMHQQQLQQHLLHSPAGPAAALAAELGVDVATAQRIHDLQQQKQQAVDREDYDEAKRIKAVVDRLRAAGGAIAGLEARKLAAVQDEDYDLAKQLKLDIDRMRAAAYTAALSGRGGGNVGDAPTFSPAPRNRRSSVSGGAGDIPASTVARRLSENAMAGSPPYAAEDAGTNSFASPPAAAAAAARRRSQPSPAGEWSAHDERPAQGKGAYSFNAADATSLPPSNRHSSTPGGGVATAAAPGAARGSDAGPPPPGFPTDLPPPEALTAADAKDAAPLTDLLGEYLARCFYSRTWQLREAALTKLAKDLESGQLRGLDSSGDGLRTITRALLRALRDKVAAIYTACLSALRALVVAQAGSAAPRDLQLALAELLPVLAEKAADLNQRTKEQATEALLALAGVPAAGLRGATACFLRPLKPAAAWKVVLGRLQLLAALLPAIGLAPEGAGGEGFRLEPLMAFVGAALGNSSAEVRAAAISLTVQISQLAGPAVQRLLPTDLNPKLKEQIEQGMLAAASAPPAATAPAAKTKPSPRQQPTRQQQQEQQASATRPAGAPQQQEERPRAAGAAAVPGGEDPAVYEAEVRAREARLGPSHPEVAEAICNLAILHNQRGNVEAALPLYERALGIWEAAQGPSSADVAHTLTDIAVIHLEKGRDAVGRPLLQSALDIQLALLGPEHPDVIAIKEVLEEDEGAEAGLVPPQA